MMQLPTFSLRSIGCAIALMGASLVHAQTQPAVNVAEPAAAQADVHKHPSKRMHRHAPEHKAGKKHHATPQQREAAAVARERRRGSGTERSSDDQINQYERNALQRCAIFKTDDDRRACVERVRQPQISGSVEGGGLIREYTQTVRVPAAPQVPHGAHSQEEPVRK